MNTYRTLFVMILSILCISQASYAGEWAAVQAANQRAAAEAQAKERAAAEARARATAAQQAREYEAARQRAYGQKK